MRRVSGVDILSLRGASGGTFCVPREWTDRGVASQAHASHEIGAPILDYAHLLALADLIEQVARCANEVDK